VAYKGSWQGYRGSKVWEYRGVTADGDPPSCVGAYSGTLVIVGSGPCVWDDLESFPVECDRMAIGNVGMHLSGLTHWASLHTAEMPHLAQIRSLDNIYKRETRPLLHCHKPTAYIGKLPEFMRHSISHYWYLSKSYQTSGIFGVQIALAMGYDNIILAGLPCDNSGSYWGDYTKTRQRHGIIQPRWACLVDETSPHFLSEAKRCVRSLSGHTKEVFGAPNERAVAA
jgi:hypothetical protein